MKIEIDADEIDDENVAVCIIAIRDLVDDALIEGMTEDEVMVAMMMVIKVMASDFDPIGRVQ